MTSLVNWSVLSETLRIDLPTAPLALALLERLADFRAEVLPMDGKGYQVLVELDGGPGADDRARAALAEIESWAESAGVNTAEINLNDRPVRPTRPDESPLRSRDTPESVGLVCRIKTTVLGAGVQVVSVEGELDLHTAPQLDELLRSTDADHVILDLTEAPFVDSTTIGVVVAESKRMAGQDRQLSIVAGNRAVTRLLAITGLDGVLEVHQSLPESVESALGRAVEAHGTNNRGKPAR